MKRRLRIWAIKQGLIDPKDLQETKEIFTFPVAKQLATTKNRLNFMQRVR